MADTKVSDLPTVSSLASGDLFYVIDASDTTDDPAGSSKGVSVANALVPIHTLVFNGTLPAAHNTNTNADISWNDSVEHADVTHTDGDAAINLDEAGEYDLYFNVEVTNGAANNRQTWCVDLRHRNSSDVEQFTYVMSAGSYIRDDAAAYDSGLCAGHFNLVVSAGDDVTLQTRVLDAQTGAGVNNADTSATYLRIFRKTYGA